MSWSVYKNFNNSVTYQHTLIETPNRSLNFPIIIGKNLINIIRQYFLVNQNAIYIFQMRTQSQT